MKRLILEQSKEEFYTSHAGLALTSACINRYRWYGRLPSPEEETNHKGPAASDEQDNGPFSAAGFTPMRPGDEAEALRQRAREKKSPRWT